MINKLGATLLALCLSGAAMGCEDDPEDLDYMNDPNTPPADVVNGANGGNSADPVGGTGG